jgi:mannose-1-phosphate guanylyltransferase/mannose-6-phosphate isomerase
VILAGGHGTRLWPLARPDRPKQFLPLLGKRSLFQDAHDRLRALVGRDRILVVTGRCHVPWVRRQAPSLPTEQVIAEEIGRNTAASVALAALWIRARFGDGVMVVTPSDHFISPASGFRSTLIRGIGAVRRAGALLTIGVRARTPETGFGYIRPGRREVQPGVRRVTRFVEKPARVRAASMVRSGRYLWNTGIFVWRASGILQALHRHAPAVLRPLDAWAARLRPGHWLVPSSLLRQVQGLPIDRAVLERSRDLLVTGSSFQWSDLGNWSALFDLMRLDRSGNGALGRLLTIDASGCLGVNPEGTTVFVGVKDIVAARSGDAVLVCHRDAAQRVREISGLYVGGHHGVGRRSIR